MTGKPRYPVRFGNGIEFWGECHNHLVEHNTFVDAGYCWSHNQRPNPNGAHLMMCDNAAPTTNFVVGRS